MNFFEKILMLLMMQFAGLPVSDDEMRNHELSEAQSTVIHERLLVQQCVDDKADSNVAVLPAQGTPLPTDIVLGHVKMVHSVALPAAEPCQELREQLLDAVRGDQVQEVQRLIDGKKVSRYDVAWIFHEAPVVKSPRVARILAKFLCDQYKKDDLNKALLAAISRGSNTRKVSALIERGADVNARVMCDGVRISPIDKAIRHGNCHIVQTLIQNGASIQDCSALCTAMLRERWDVVDFLIKDVVDIDAIDAEGKNAVHWVIISAAPCDYLGCLLQAGASVDTKDCDGRISLHWAAQYAWTHPEHKPNVLAKLAMLLKIDGDMTLVDNKGQTALFIDDKQYADAIAASLSPIVLYDAGVPFLYYGKAPALVNIKEVLLGDVAFGATHNSPA